MNVVGRRDDYPQLNDHDIVGLYDRAQDLLLIRGDQYALQPIYKAICRLADKVLERLARNHGQ